MRSIGVLAISCVAALVVAVPSASAQYIHLKDFPEIFGVYAMAGGCAKSPRLAVNATGILLEAAGKRTLYDHPDVELGYNGQEDTNVTVAVRGLDAGLIIAFARDGSFAYTLGGERLTPEERALEAVAGANNSAQLIHCGAPRPKPAAAPEPEEPKMRSVAAPTVDAVDAQGYTTDPGFMSAYAAALGPLKRSDPWLTEFEGPGDSKIVTIAGVRYLQVSSCKPHDCGDNNMLVLYRPTPRTLYGAVRLHARTPVLIGNPPPAIAAQIHALIAKEWPQQ